MMNDVQWHFLKLAPPEDRTMISVQLGSLDSCPCHPLALKSVVAVSSFDSCHMEHCNSLVVAYWIPEASLPCLCIIGSEPSSFLLHCMHDWLAPERTMSKVLYRDSLGIPKSFFLLECSGSSQVLKGDEVGGP